MRENTSRAILAEVDVGARLSRTVIERRGEEDGQREKSEDERWRSTFANDERKSDEGSARCRVRVYGRGIRGDLLLEHGGAVSHRVRTVIGEEGQVK